MNNENDADSIIKIVNAVDTLRGYAVQLGQRIEFLDNYISSPKLNKAKIDCEMQLKIKNGFIGTTDESREKNIMISLTTFPERVYEIKYCIYSLLNQTLKPNMVVLWLAEEEFPNKEKDIPDEVLKMQDYGLTIKWCNNMRSYKKLIPAMREFPDYVTATADDDLFYPENWLEGLYSSYIKHKKFINCHRVHRINFMNDSIAPYETWQKQVKEYAPSYLNFGTSGGGIIFPSYSSGIYHKDILNENIFMDICPNCDDIWFWAMSVLGKTKIAVTEDALPINYINIDREVGITAEKTLYRVNSSGGNDEAIRKIMRCYPKIYDILRNEI